MCAGCIDFTYHWAHACWGWNTYREHTEYRFGRCLACGHWCMFGRPQSDVNGRFVSGVDPIVMARLFQRLVETLYQILQNLTQIPTVVCVDIRKSGYIIHQLRSEQK